MPFEPPFDPRDLGAIEERFLDSEAGYRDPLAPSLRSAGRKRGRQKDETAAVRIYCRGSVDWHALAIDERARTRLDKAGSVSRALNGAIQREDAP